jgi:hypothetical protein
MIEPEGRIVLFLFSAMGVGFFFPSSLFTSHNHKKNKKGHSRLVKGRAFSKVKFENKKVAQNLKCPALSDAETPF